MRTYHQGVSLLHFFASVGNMDAVKDLLAKGETLRARHGVVGKSALHEAAAGGHLSMVRFLVDQGLDVNVRDNRGDTPKRWAELRGHTKVVAWLESKGGK